MIAWMLVVYGITLAITGSRLTAPLRRRLPKFFSCPMCVGFWVGLGCSLCGLSITHNFVFDAFAALAACWIIHVVLEKLGAALL